LENLYRQYKLAPSEIYLPSRSPFNNPYHSLGQEDSMDLINSKSSHVVPLKKNKQESPTTHSRVTEQELDAIEASLLQGFRDLSGIDIQLKEVLPLDENFSPFGLMPHYTSDNHSSGDESTVTSLTSTETTQNWAEQDQGIRQILDQTMQKEALVRAEIEKMAQSDQLSSTPQAELKRLHVEQQKQLKYLRALIAMQDNVNRVLQNTQQLSEAQAVDASIKVNIHCL
jgi:hypothetical protein